MEEPPAGPMGEAGRRPRGEEAEAAEEGVSRVAPFSGPAELAPDLRGALAEEPPPRVAAGGAAAGGAARREPAFAARPGPFAAAWALRGGSGLASPPGPVSLQELQRRVGPVGSRVAREEAPWASGLRLVALALATQVPTECLPWTARASPEAAREAPAPPPVPSEPAEEGPGQEPPRTGLQAAETFAGKWHAGKIRFVYLNVAPSRHFRPYDLVTVPKRLAHAQHYVFSPHGVLHVHPEEGAEALSLGRWHREAVLWQLMQAIPFFRLFLVHKAFVRWCFNVKHLQFLRRREQVRLQLLQAVPHFGVALLQISR